MNERVNPTLLKFVALTMVEGLVERMGPDLVRKKRELQEKVGPSLSEDDFRLAEAACMEVMFHTIELLPEFSGDVIEALSKNGMEGVWATLQELSRELSSEIVRALMRIVGKRDLAPFSSASEPLARA
jgi:hypothetical protein